MAGSNMDEKRKHSRVAFATDISIHLEAEGKTIEVQGDSKDISLKGVFISTEDLFDTGAKCEIKIYLSGGVDRIEIAVQGTVVRVSENGMGIVFDSMDVESYSHLKNIVRYNSVDDSA